MSVTGWPQSDSWSGADWKLFNCFTRHYRECEAGAPHPKGGCESRTWDGVKERYRRAQSSFSAALVLRRRACSNCGVVRWNRTLALEAVGQLVFAFRFLLLTGLAIGFSQSAMSRSVLRIIFDDRL
jgi:hypothetical protein